MVVAEIPPQVVAGNQPYEEEKIPENGLEKELVEDKLIADELDCLQDASLLDLECIQKILDNIEAKFDGKPMPWTVEALNKKSEFLHQKFKMINYIVFEKREVYDQKEHHKTVLKRLL